MSMSEGCEWQRERDQACEPVPEHRRTKLCAGGELGKGAGPAVAASIPWACHCACVLVSLLV